MAHDPVKIKEFVKLGIVEKLDKPTQTPDHIAELIRRRKQIPQQWYPFVITTAYLYWVRFLEKDSWIKIVYDNADVIIGKVSKKKSLNLYSNSVLFNGDLGDTDTRTDVKSSIIQGFTDDKTIAEASKRNA